MSGISRRAAGKVAILEAAERLFSDQGFDGVSMSAVAQLAGVSKANIYHHFSSKEVLYMAVLRSSVAQTRVLLDALEEPSGNLEDRLRSFAHAHLRDILKRESASRLILREALSGDERKTRKLADEVVGDVYSRMTSIFREGQAAGVLRPDTDPALCAFLFLSANVFFFQSRIMMKQFPEAGFEEDPAAYSQGMADLLLNGMLSGESGDG